jgi:hypothetical protein
MEQNQTPLVTPSMPSIQSAPSKQKISALNKILIIFVVFGFIILLIMGGVFAYRFTQNKNPISKSSGPDMLSNQPLYNFTGSIEMISGPVLTISEKSYIYPSDLTTKEKNIKPEEKKTTYLITVSDQTKIISELPPVPYSLKLATPSATTQNNNLNSLKIGQRVSVITKENLRDTRLTNFTADSITISAGLTSFMGKVKSIKNNTILLKVTPPSYPEEKDFDITITKNTEIVISDIMTNSSETTKKKTQQPVSTLTEGTTIMVYTDADINQNTNLNALKIEVVKNL